jgi:hypothetical protein
MNMRRRTLLALVLELLDDMVDEAFIEVLTT